MQMMLTRQLAWAEDATGAHTCRMRTRLLGACPQRAPTCDDTRPRTAAHLSCMTPVGGLQMVAARQALDSLVITTLQRVRDHAGVQKTRSKTLDIVLLRVDSGVWLKGTKGQVQCPASSPACSRKAPCDITSGTGRASARARAWMPSTVLHVWTA